MRTAFIIAAIFIGCFGIVTIILIGDRRKMNEVDARIERARQEIAKGARR